MSILRKILFSALFCLAILKPSMTEAVSLEPKKGMGYAVFAGGCFWCTEADFEKIDGVVSVVSGYTGGTEVNPTYDQVSRRATSHTEAVLVIFDSNKVMYKDLVEKFWTTIDPTVQNRQFCDVGPQYRTGIFYLDSEQEQIAKASKQRLIESKTLGDNPVYTEITKASAFYKAEDYHQNYYKTNPLRYQFYRQSCGRDARLKQLWGDKK